MRNDCHHSTRVERGRDKPIWKCSGDRQEWRDFSCNQEIEFVNVTICCCSRSEGRRCRWTNLNKQNDSLAVRYISIVSSFVYSLRALVKWVSSMMLTRCVSFKDRSLCLNSGLSPSVVWCVLVSSYLFPRQIYDAKQNSAAFPFPYLVKAMLTTTTIYARHQFDWEYARILHPLSAYAMISTDRWDICFHSCHKG